MTHEEYETMPAIEHLRLMARNFGGCSESFNQQFSFEKLLAIHRAWMLSEWDFNPDTWTRRQLREALRGKPPRWDDQEKPLYG